MDAKSWKHLAAWMGVTFAAGIAGSATSMDAPQFYGALVKPPWAPPAWLFGPAWTILYVLIAVAAWLAWQRAPIRTTKGLWAIFAAQLVANAAWSWLFFGAKSGVAAFWGAVVLEVLVLATLVAFWQVRRVSGALLMPYAGWVAFATALTWSVWRANPVLLG